MELRQALKIVEAGLAKAAETSTKAAVVVVDPSADVIVVARDEGAVRHTVEMARGKAMVSAMFQAPSSALDGADSASQRINAVVNGDLVFIGGAVPVFAGGQLVGAVGVSGSTGEIDEQIAQAAAAALG